MNRFFRSQLVSQIAESIEYGTMTKRTLSEKVPLAVARTTGHRLLESPLLKTTGKHTNDVPSRSAIAIKELEDTVSIYCNRPQNDDDAAYEKTEYRLFLGVKIIAEVKSSVRSDEMCTRLPNCLGAGELIFGFLDISRS